MGPILDRPGSNPDEVAQLARYPSGPGCDRFVLDVLADFTGRDALTALVVVGDRLTLFFPSRNEIAFVRR